MSRKFKIHADEVRKAAKKTGLDIESRTTINQQHNCACPIGQLYLAETGDESRYNDDKAIEWAKKKFGKFYIAGFIRGFDGEEKNYEFYDLVSLDDITITRQRDKQRYSLGYENGKRLRKFLL